MASDKHLWAPHWCNQTYTIGGAKFSKNPGFTVELLGADNVIDAHIQLIQKDRPELLHKWLGKYASKSVSIFCESGSDSGYVTFYISSGLSVIYGEGKYGAHLDMDMLKSQSSFVFQCKTS
jgi:hypothetical protein